MQCAFAGGVWSLHRASRSTLLFEPCGVLAGAGTCFVQGAAPDIYMRQENNPCTTNTHISCQSLTSSAREGMRLRQRLHKQLHQLLGFAGFNSVQISCSLQRPAVSTFSLPYMHAHNRSFAACLDQSVLRTISCAAARPRSVRWRPFTTSPSGEARQAQHRAGLARENCRHLLILQQLPAVQQITPPQYHAPSVAAG